MHKYLIVTLLFLVIIIFLDNNNLISRYHRRMEISTLQSAIDSTRAVYEDKSQQLNEMDSDANAIEKVARREYRMHAPGEDIFVIQDTSSKSPTTLGQEADEKSKPKADTDTPVNDPTD